MMLWAEGAARARALRLGMSGEQEAGHWGAGMRAASLEGDSIRAQFRGALGRASRGAGTPRSLSHALSAEAGIFRMSSCAPSSLPVAAVTLCAGGFLGPLGLLFPLWGRLVTLPHILLGAAINPQLLLLLGKS